MTATHRGRALSRIAGVAAGLAVAASLVGCGMSASPMGAQPQTQAQQGQEAVRTTRSSAYEMKVGAQNPMANESLMLTVTGVERRPVSTFTNAGGTVGVAGGGTKAKGGDPFADSAIAIEVDVSYTYNPTSLSTNTKRAGGDAKASARTLGDLLQPGKLMYITGKDADGNDYVATDVVTMPVTQGGTSLVGARWDFDALAAELPQPATTRTGSIVFVASGTASELTLHIITASDNPSPLDADSVADGNNLHYTLPLS